MVFSYISLSQGALSCPDLKRNSEESGARMDPVLTTTEVVRTTMNGNKIGLWDPLVWVLWYNFSFFNRGISSVRRPSVPALLPETKHVEALLLSITSHLMPFHTTLHVLTEYLLYAYYINRPWIYIGDQHTVYGKARFNFYIFLVSSVWRELKIKTRYHYTPSRISNTTLNAGQHKEQQELSFFVVGNAKWCCQRGGQFNMSSKTIQLLPI